VADQPVQEANHVGVHVRPDLGGADERMIRSGSVTVAKWVFHARVEAQRQTFERWTHEFTRCAVWRQWIATAIVAGCPLAASGGPMARKTTIICLANSRKHWHRCIAGIEYPSPSTYRWVRPISDRNGHGVSKQEIALENGAEPRPLDVVEIGLTEWRPDDHQQENYLIDINTSWRHLGRCTWQQALTLPMLPDPLWVTGGNTNNGGINYCISETQAADLTDSLRLVRSQVTIHVSQHYYPNKPLEVWAEFHHASQFYRLKVTDSIAADRFRTQGIGDYPLGESILTISLGEKWNGEIYKLVAAVIEKSLYS
jgi:hypothetical protein